MGLEVALVLAQRAEGMLEDVGRPVEGRLNLLGARPEDRVRHAVRIVGHHLLRGGPGPHVARIVDQRRAGPRRLDRVEDGRELVVLDLDQPERLLGRLAVLGRHRGHLLADEADLVAGQDGHVAHRAADAVRRQVPARQHRVHARQRAGAAGVDRHDPRVRQRAPQDPGPQHARADDVGGVLRGHARLSTKLGG